MRRIVRRARDPFTVSLIVIVALGAAGFAALLLAWRGAAGKSILALQLPYAVSGAVAGLALIIISCTLLSIQSRRYSAARRRVIIDRAIRTAERILVAAADPVRSERRGDAAGEDDVL
jgi:hypothetical protein